MNLRLREPVRDDETQKLDTIERIPTPGADWTRKAGVI